MKTTEKDPLPTETPSFDGVAIATSAGGVNAINAVFVDISHNKNLEEQLKNSTTELETTNEELQSTNDELNQRTNELNVSKSFLETILGNLNVGIVVVDRDFRILNWNSMAEDLWGLRSDEIMGRSILGLDIGLPVEQLKHPIRLVMNEKFNTMRC